MARYLVKRKIKQFGFISGAVNGVGSATEAIGNATKSGLGQTAAGIGSAMTFGSALSGMMGGGILGTALGYGASYLGGKIAANAVGSGLSTMGQSMQNYM